MRAQSRCCQILVLIAVVVVPARGFDLDLKAIAELLVAGQSLGPAQEFHLLTNYRRLNLAGMAGEAGGGLSDSAYQAAQAWFHRHNNGVIQDVVDNMRRLDPVRYGRLEAVVPQVSGPVRPGTDFDITLRFSDGTRFTATDVMRARETYNTHYAQRLDTVAQRATGAGARAPRYDPRGRNFAALNQTDLMPHHAQVDPQEFARIAAVVNHHGGMMYDDAEAVTFELRGAQAFDDRVSQPYFDQMARSVEHKIHVIEQVNDRLALVERAQRNLERGGRPPHAMLSTQIRELRAEIQQEQSLLAKYLHRQQTVNRVLAEKHGLDPQASALPVDARVQDSLRLAATQRGPTSAEAARLVAANAQRIDVANRASMMQTYARIASARPQQAGSAPYISDAAALARGLDFEQRRAVRLAIERQLAGSESGRRTAQALTRAVNAVPPPPARHGVYYTGRVGGSFRLIPSTVQARTVGQVMGWAGRINTLIAATDALVEHDLPTAAYHLGHSYVIGKGFSAVFGGVVQLVPKATPVVMAYGAYSASNQLTRYAMERIHIAGRSLDEHLQQGLDDLFFLSAVSDQEGDEHLRRLLLRGLEHGSLHLPEGMDVSSAFAQVLERSRSGQRPVFAFLATRPQKPDQEEETAAPAHPFLRVDALDIDALRGTSQEDIEHANALLRLLRRGLENGTLALPEGMSLMQAYKIVLLRAARSGERIFAFLAVERPAVVPDPQARCHLMGIGEPQVYVQPVAHDPNRRGDQRRREVFVVVDSHWRIDRKAGHLPHGSMILRRDGVEVARRRFGPYRYAFEAHERGTVAQRQAYRLLDWAHDTSPEQQARTIQAQERYLARSWALALDTDAPGSVLAMVEQIDDNRRTLSDYDDPELRRIHHRPAEYAYRWRVVLVDPLDDLFDRDRDVTHYQYQISWEPATDGLVSTGPALDRYTSLTMAVLPYAASAGGVRAGRPRVLVQAGDHLRSDEPPEPVVGDHYQALRSALALLHPRPTWPEDAEVEPFSVHTSVLPERFVSEYIPMSERHGGGYIMFFMVDGHRVAARGQYADGRLRLWYSMPPQELNRFTGPFNEAHAVLSVTDPQQPGPAQAEQAVQIMTGYGGGGRREPLIADGLLLVDLRHHDGSVPGRRVEMWWSQGRLHGPVMTDRYTGVFQDGLREGAHRYAVEDRRDVHRWRSDRLHGIARRQRSPQQIEELEFDHGVPLRRALFDADGEMTMQESHVQVDGELVLHGLQVQRRRRYAGRTTLTEHNYHHGQRHGWQSVISIMDDDGRQIMNSHDRYVDGVLAQTRRYDQHGTLQVETWYEQDWCAMVMYRVDSTRAVMPGVIDRMQVIKANPDQNERNRYRIMNNSTYRRIIFRSPTASEQAPSENRIASDECVEAGSRVGLLRRYAYVDDPPRLRSVSVELVVEGQRHVRSVIDAEVRNDSFPEGVLASALAQQSQIERRFPMPDELRALIPSHPEIEQ